MKIQAKAMKRAHLIFKATNISFSNALRRAWKQVKLEADTKAPVVIRSCRIHGNRQNNNVNRINHLFNNLVKHGELRI